MSNSRRAADVVTYVPIFGVLVAADAYVMSVLMFPKVKCVHYCKYLDMCVELACGVCAQRDD